jgi:hypothetical protein
VVNKCNGRIEPSASVILVLSKKQPISIIEFYIITYICNKCVGLTQDISQTRILPDDFSVVDSTVAVVVVTVVVVVEVILVVVVGSSEG